MPIRTGESTILKLTLALCRFLAKYTTVIVLLYPGNLELHAALSVASTACQELNTLLQAEQIPGD